MNVLKITAAGLILAMLAGCANNGYGTQTPGGFSKEGMGTVLGGVGGAVAGSAIGKGKGNIVAIAAGTLLGAALGNSVGASLDRADMQYYNQSSQRALENTPSGQVVEWRNPDSGNSGTIVPQNVYRSDNGQYCREYSQTIRVGGELKKGYGQACRQPDGEWRIVSN